jgi:hypothetical protein
MGDWMRSRDILIVPKPVCNVLVVLELTVNAYIHEEVRTSQLYSRTLAPRYFSLDFRQAYECVNKIEQSSCGCS